MSLPVSLYTSAQVRAMDRAAAERLGIAGHTLMERAGEGALRALRGRWPGARRVTVVCGPGNNAGDGYVLARLARAAGCSVTVLAASPPERLRGDALDACTAWRAAGGTIEPFTPQALTGAEVLVDALLGTGLTGAVREDLTAAIGAINTSGRAVLALDVPSGLDADSGMPLGAAVRAECTVTFVALKSGLYLGDGPQYCGALVFDDLGLTGRLADLPQPRLERLVRADLQQALAPRARAAHKGDFGHVLIVGGGPGMPGAARLAGEACLRVGAGRVTVAVAPQNLAAVSLARPELMCVPLGDANAVRTLAERCDLVAIGPGLGQDAWARAALDAALACGKPLVVDADALNLLAAAPRAARPSGWILTPHPGEAGRLLGMSAAQVQRDRLGALEALVARYGGVVVLKGAGTLVGCAGAVAAVCEHGNPGMASPGMGDVLTGIIAGILAQCRDPWRAARAAVLLHALAGDAAARGGERGLLAGDLIEELRRCVNF